MVFTADQFHACITYENDTFTIHKVMGYLQTPLDNLLPDRSRQVLSLNSRTMQNKKYKIPCYAKSFFV